jgi:hypothetical protein
MLQTQPGWQLPLEEASALCLRHDAASQTVQLLAVDDEQYELAFAAIDGGVVPAAEAEDVRAAVSDAAARTGGSDFEGVASDASSQVFVLQEGADRVLVFDEGLGVVNRTITLSVPRNQPDFGSEWHEDDNARGEGLLLLRNGHLLVAKQRKEPGRRRTAWPPRSARCRARAGAPSLLSGTKRFGLRRCPCCLLRSRRTDLAGPPASVISLTPV